MLDASTRAIMLRFPSQLVASPRPRKSMQVRTDAFRHRLLKPDYARQQNGQLHLFLSDKSQKSLPFRLVDFFGQLSTEEFDVKTRNHRAQLDDI
jgi:hypothetical protein